MTIAKAEGIPRFTAIHVSYKFEGEPRPLKKWFVVLHHINGHAVCLKPTHRVDRYTSDPQKMAGCVFYKAGEVSCFPEDTAIPPDNQFAISHVSIDAEISAGNFKSHSLPDDFQEKLIESVNLSEDLTGRERTRILPLIQ